VSNGLEFTELAQNRQKIAQVLHWEEARLPRCPKPAYSVSSKPPRILVAPNTLAAKTCFIRHCMSATRFTYWKDKVGRHGPVVTHSDFWMIIVGKLLDRAGTRVHVQDPVSPGWFAPDKRYEYTDRLIVKFSNFKSYPSSSVTRPGENR
jgi:hypothetical protein